jgi:hypothetical protein
MIYDRFDIERDHAPGGVIVAGTLLPNTHMLFLVSKGAPPNGGADRPERWPRHAAFPQLLIDHEAREQRGSTQDEQRPERNGAE